MSARSPTANGLLRGHSRQCAADIRNRRDVTRPSLKTYVPVIPSKRSATVVRKVVCICTSTSHKKVGSRALRGFPGDLGYFYSSSYLREKRTDHRFLVDAMALTVPFFLIWHSRGFVCLRKACGDFGVPLHICPASVTAGIPPQFCKSVIFALYRIRRML